MKADARSPLVRASSGTFRGRGSDIREFRGIPFAAPPLGPLRWRAPQPVGRSGAVHDATEFGFDPVQLPGSAVDTRAPGVSEDCLTLNIWAPTTVPAGGAPVMVWFFGGSFVYGSASQAHMDGAHFARRGVVLVTANYRLGAFGYLAHPLLTRESPQRTSGNYGLLDQVAALRWVRENIAAFGGDARRVTASGTSAGAASVALLSTSPLGHDLFDRAILQSPGAFRPLCSLGEAERWGQVAGEDLAAMRALPAAEVLALNGRIGPAVRQLTSPRVLRPIHDGVIVPLDESDAFTSGAFRAVPVIVGSTLDEGREFAGALPVRTPAEFTAYLEANFGAHAEEARTLYPGADAAGVGRSLAGVFGDTQFTYGARGLARAFAAKEPRTFRYLYAHRSSDTAPEPAHGAETPLAFGNGTGWNAGDRAVAELLARYWVRFAECGDPNGDDLPPWPPYDASSGAVLRLERTVSVAGAWRAPQLDFVERFYAARAASPANARAE